MTDHYLSIVNQWATLLRTLTTYFPKTEQVAIADDSILGSGANYFIVLLPGFFPKEDISAQDARYDWQILTDIYARYVSEKDTTTGLMALRSAVIELHRVNRDDLGSTDLTSPTGIIGSTLDANDTMQYVMSEGMPNAGPVFKTQRLTLTVNQYVDQIL